MIHDEHPFQTPPEDRDPVRQFRGRLVAPVTVVTAGHEETRAGLTVSSLMIAEGDPSSVVVLIGRETDLWEAVHASGRFVVHILDSELRDDADAFAAIRPRPGGMFSGVDTNQTAWGPTLSEAPNRVYCRVISTTELPFHQLVQAEIDKVEVADLDDPAIYYRGDYRKLQQK